jgi:hypothetical protein
MQWKQAEEATQGLLRARAITLDRYKHSLRQLGLTADANLAPDHVALQRQPITEETFDALHEALVAAFDKPLPALNLPPLKLTAAGAAGQSGAQGSGSLYLTQMEHHELNELLPEANDRRVASFVLSTLASVLAYIPDLDAKLAFWGLGGGARVFGGDKMSTALNTAAGIAMGSASLLQESAGMASRTASYQRRADDWTFQCNQAARELMQQGRQLIASLIAEQAARKEHENVIAQVTQSSEVNDFLATKFTGRDLHHWMQGELSRLHRSYFDFAVYTARKAESAVKNELMRPELDGSNFVRNDYWDGGRRGLLAGEALHLDLKRLELAYAENNKHEDVLTKPVSLRRLDPLALLQLQATGECRCSIPEWIFDLDRPGHYMRRIRRVSLALPGVVGPYAAPTARLNLMRSTLRKAPGGAIYARQGNDDPRFKDYGSAPEVTVSLMPGEAAAEPSLARDQLLPYEGHGVESEWRIKLPKAYRQFDYRSASDAILQIQYSARSGGDALAGAAEANLDAVTKKAEGKPFAIMISIAEEFPVEWDRFVSGTTPDLRFDLDRDLLPYLVSRRKILLLSVQAHVIDVLGQRVIDGDPLSAAGVAKAELALNDVAKAKAAIAMPKDAVLVADRQVRPYLIVRFAVKP